MPVNEKMKKIKKTDIMKFLFSNSIRKTVEVIS